jgi:hypothetical protein
MPASPILVGLTSIKSALNRLMKQIDEEFRPYLKAGKMPCPHCGRDAKIHLSMPDFVPTQQHGTHTHCLQCGSISYVALSGIAGSTPQARCFMKAHPRIHLLPPRFVEHEGRDAIVLRAESVRDYATLDTIFAVDTYELLRIFRNGAADDNEA